MTTSLSWRAHRPSKTSRLLILAGVALALRSGCVAADPVEPDDASRTRVERADLDQRHRYPLADESALDEGGGEYMDENHEEVDAGEDGDEQEWEIEWEEEEEWAPSVDSGLRFEGDVELVINRLNNFTLAEQPADEKRESEQEIDLGLSYRHNDWLFAFGEITIVADQEVFADDTPRVSEEEVERGETWVYLKQIFDSGYSLQLGRQNFFEPRLWWWDADLDALRLYYERDPWAVYVGLAQEIAPVSTQFQLIEPEDDDARRLLAQARWTRSEGFNLDGFFLHQRDDSTSPAPDSVIDSAREDESDADLAWAGLRVSGRLAPVRYRVDAAIVRGDETLFEFDDDEPGSSRVESREHTRVRGWAVDFGIDWAVALPGSPSLNFIYGYGSGDDDPHDGVDRTFHQTGLQDKDEEFRDYGQLLRPDLSNLRIATVASGFSVHRNARLWLGYHRFRQVDAAPFLRDGSLDAEPTGNSKDIGEELSLVFDLWPRENFRIQLIGATFRAGNAYGDAAGERAERLYFKLNYAF